MHGHFSKPRHFRSRLATWLATFQPSLVDSGGSQCSDVIAVIVAVANRSAI